jgi:hypothetical protein
LWDNSITDKDVFVVLDSDNVLHTFIVYPDDVEEGGTSCVNLGKTKVKYRCPRKITDRGQFLTTWFAPRGELGPLG